MMYSFAPPLCSKALRCILSFVQSQSPFGGNLLEVWLLSDSPSRNHVPTRTFIIGCVYSNNYYSRRPSCPPVVRGGAWEVDLHPTVQYLYRRL